MKAAGRSRCGFPCRSCVHSDDDKQTWGINVERYIRRRNEGSWLEMVPKKETGRASRMVHLTASMASNRRADWNCCRIRPVAPNTSRQHRQ